MSLLRADALSLLADKIEHAPPEEQAALLLEAFKALPREEQYYWQRPGWGRFQKLVEAQGYESAALMLFPDGWTAWEWDSRAGRTRFIVDISRLSDCDAGEDWTHGRGSAASLAFAAGCLRAHAADMIRASA